MNRHPQHVAADIVGLMASVREQGGGVRCLTLIDGRPAFAETGLSMLIPADTSDREIAGQSQDYAVRLLEGRAGA